jgi:hypothetical protein
MGLARAYHTGAVFSDCGRYRYVLWRSLTGRFDEPHTSVLWCLLNPSTADAFKLDPTLTRCLNYTKAWGYQQMAVVNLFAYRSTKPSGLVELKARGISPVGREDDFYLGREINGADLVVCGWGMSVPDFGKDRPGEALEMIANAGKVPYALAVNSDNSPGHPLYLKADLRPRPISELLAERARAA